MIVKKPRSQVGKPVDGVPIIHVAPDEQPPKVAKGRTFKMDEVNANWLHEARKLRDGK